MKMTPDDRQILANLIRSRLPTWAVTENAVRYINGRPSIAVLAVRGLNEQWFAIANDRTVDFSNCLLTIEDSFQGRGWHKRLIEAVQVALEPDIRHTTFELLLERKK